MWGDGALAAVGASGPILNLLLVLFMGISVGAGIMVSQYFGAKEKQKLSDTVGTTITATLISSIFIMIVGPLVSPLCSAHCRRQVIFIRCPVTIWSSCLRASWALRFTTSFPASSVDWGIPLCR